MVNCFNMIYIIHIKVIVILNRINILLIYIIHKLTIKVDSEMLEVETFISVSIDVIFFGLNYKNNILILFRF